MRNVSSNILLVVTCLLVLSGCSDNEVVTSFESIKEATPEPIVFTPYVGINIEQEATTRADLNYLSYVNDGNGDGFLNVFKDFPWYNPTTGIGSATGEKNGYDNYREGKLSNNSYIVGIYGYYGGAWSTLTNETNLSNLAANFMTNQPLLHTSSSVWEYSPVRYWPNTSGDKVTFISYYPFQDFEDEDFYRNGQTVGVEKYADLTCIEPPQKGASGENSYSFTFTQHENLEKQVDFLLGINEYSKQNVSSGITLNLKHTLCAVAFDIRFTDFNLLDDNTTPKTNNMTSIRIDINSVGLEGLYGKGKVFPSLSGNSIVINWPDEYLDNDGTSYTLTFDDASNFGNRYTRPFFEWTKNGGYTNLQTNYGTKNNLRYKRQDIYDNYNNGANSRGMKYLMLVIPQKAEYDKDGNAKDSYLVMNYDMTYTFTENAVEKRIVYKDCVEKIKLKDNQKTAGDKTKMFNPGKFITFNIRFKGLRAIRMDAVETDWVDTIESDLETEKEETSGNG